MRSLLLLATVLSTALPKQIPTSTDLSTTVASANPDTTPWPGPLVPADKLTVSCERDSMYITITLAHKENLIDDTRATFSGIVYPAGLGTTSKCLREYVGARGDLQYSLPLQGCNTMPLDHDDGTVEYYNNIIVQPNLELVTGQGRGYHVRCRYRKRDMTNFHVFRPRADRLTSGGATDDDEYDEESGLLPSVTLKIYKGDPKDNEVASEVAVGEPLTMVVNVEKQRRYGALVAECAAADGLGDASLDIIDHDGCPVDRFLMGGFEYSDDKRTAQVTFPAHKFPHTDSIYYTCNVKLCDFKYNSECEPCSKGKRVRRQAEESPAKVEVFTGLYVNEADSIKDNEVTSEKKEDEICISQRNFAIGICIAGIILMICVIAAIAFILARRRSPKTYSRTGSSLYSGPYTNTGYSHTS